MSLVSQPLALGMFVMPVHDPDKPMVQCFDEDLELAVQCETLGFADFWVGEHHSSAYENIVMPEIFLGKVLGLTHSIRIGAARSACSTTTRLTSPGGSHSSIIFLTDG